MDEDYLVMDEDFSIADVIETCGYHLGSINDAEFSSERSNGTAQVTAVSLRTAACVSLRIGITGSPQSYQPSMPQTATPNQRECAKETLSSACDSSQI
ncbi:unnamed protein product [Cuscuta campestris]|uniref:Uncharacterized protein n=1 Tax=Cuscuta campestris TaxID=132261 RepID=A0A484MXY9_9ASTE|nr:unnamed protein product [Cuscuta campestris]